MKLIIFIALVQCCICQEEWQPLLKSNVYQQNPQRLASPFSGYEVQQYQLNHLSSSAIGGQCELFKVVFTQESLNQYVQFKIDMPELKEFTLCFWNKFSNHSNDHPIFSYGVHGQPKSIYSWVSNTESSSFYSMAINGQTFYRLNYPLRSNRWYHTCQSWNGKTGEWQIWVNAERVGRGFHNRLVGHIIPAEGIAIAGQDQSQEKDSIEKQNLSKPTNGMLGEVTMMQLYSVALTAGKAHKDHKHHHAHKFDHNGAPITTTPNPTVPLRPSQPTHPLLTGGQLNPGVALTIAVQQPQLIQGQQFNSQYQNGQFAPALVSQQLTAAQVPQTIQNAQNDIGSYSQQSLSIGGQPLLNNGLVHPSINNPVQYINHENGESNTHNLFKRQTSTARYGQITDMIAREKQKRDLVINDGHLIDDSLLVENYDQSLLDGLAGIGQNEPVLQQQKKEEREPAEAEVIAVMNVCSGCDQEPFAKALVFGWRSVGKTMYAGAIYSPAVTECRVF